MPQSKKPRKKKSIAPKAKQEPSEPIHIDFDGPDDLLPGLGEQAGGMESLMKGIQGMFGDTPFGSGPKDPVDQAQELMYEAWECSDPKQRIALANKAIETSPLCADAYNLLAEEKAKTKKMALAYYRQGVEAGRQAIGGDGFEEYRGHFWGFLETRPYMRARAGEAEMLWETGEKQAAVDSYKEMLELNPGDNQGIRYILVAYYLELGQFDELKELFKEYGDEYSADMQYTRALVAFIEGDDGAAKIAAEAFQTNQHVPVMLSGRKKTVPLTGYITMGGKDEATGYVRANRKSWRKAEGAIEWLEEVTSMLAPNK